MTPEDRLPDGTEVVYRHGKGLAWKRLGLIVGAARNYGGDRWLYLVRSYDKGPVVRKYPENVRPY